MGSARHWPNGIQVVEHRFKADHGLSDFNPILLRI